MITKENDIELEQVDGHYILFDRGLLPIRTLHSFVKNQDAEYFSALQFTHIEMYTMPSNVYVFICNRGNRNYNHDRVAGRWLSWGDFTHEYLVNGAFHMRADEAKLEILLGTLHNGYYVPFCDDKFFDFQNTGTKTQNYNAIPDFAFKLYYKLLEVKNVA